MITVHHLNVGCADCSAIVTPTETLLFDCYGIENHRHVLPNSKRIRAVFISHQHRDHYDGLAYLRKHGYEIETLVASPYKRRSNDASVTPEEWREFDSHRQYFERRGTKVYQPFRQSSFSKPWWQPDGLKIWIVGPAKSIATSSTREIHDACLVVHVKIGTRRFLFTGDASDTNLQDIADTTNNYCNDVLHASHHGSINGACLDFVKGANAKATVISTQAGVHSNVPHATALRRYADHTAGSVYRTDKDGSLKWSV